MRYKDVKTKLTEDEYEHLDLLARDNRTTKADMLRWFAFGPDHVRKYPNRDEIEKIAAAARGMGRNVNQIAKALNTLALREEKTLSDVSPLERSVKVLEEKVADLNKKLDAVLIIK